VNQDKLPALASARMHLLPPYLFGELNRIKMEKRQAGEDIIDFVMGNPSDPAPDWVVDKLCEVARDPRNHRYSVSTGIFNLKREAARLYARHYRVELDPAREVVCTIGSKEGLSHLCLAVLGPGDSVLVPAPAFPIHVYAPIIAGANVIGVPMGEGSDEECSRRLLAGIEHTCQHIRPKPKMVIVCYPHNPTARVAEKPFYEELVRLARKHSFLIIHDFAYARTAFDGFKPPSLLEVEGAKNLAVEFWTVSKPYNMAGFRVGFCMGNADMCSLLGKIKGYYDYGIFQAVQVAAIMALREGDEFARHQAEVYQQRRDVLCKGLLEMGWELELPRGCMFVWAKIPEVHRSMGSIEYAKKLMDEALVAASPGAGFGPDGEGYMRFALVENEKRIQQALRQMRRMMRDEEKAG
jgi:alanine-synthesizing transaminase